MYHTFGGSVSICVREGPRAPFLACDPPERDGGNNINNNNNSGNNNTI